MKEPLSAVERLIAMGFRKCGDWRLEADRLSCSITEHGDASNVLYAFISNGQVLYIGKTTRRLRKRMYDYQNPVPSQRTSWRGNGSLKTLIGSGGSVDLYALPDHGLLYYGGFHVNLAAGLEDSLIKDLKPSWNMAGL